MNLWKKRIGACLCAALLTQLCGCVMTVDQMYVPPRRSESYLNLQAVIDEAMGDLELLALYQARDPVRTSRASRWWI